MSHVSQNHLPSVIFIFLNVAEIISIINALVPIKQYFGSFSASVTDTLYGLAYQFQAFNLCVSQFHNLFLWTIKESNLIKMLHT